MTYKRVDVNTALLSTGFCSLGVRLYDVVLME